MINKLLDKIKYGAYDNQVLNEILDEVGALLNEERIYRNARQKNAPNCSALLKLLEEKERSFLNEIKRFKEQSLPKTKQLFDE